MNKLLFFIIGLALFAHKSLGQKPTISLNGERWGSYGAYLISNNGEYMAYITTVSGKTNLFIKSTLSSRQVSIPGESLFAISQDSRKVIFMIGDSIGIIDLKNPNEVIYLKDVARFDVVKWGRDYDLLVYTTKQHLDRLVVRYIESGEEEVYSGVENYWTSEGGNTIVLETVGNDSGKTKYTLNWLDIGKNELRPIWAGTKVEDLKIGHYGLQCVFIARSIADTSGNGIWLYRDVDTKAVEILGTRSERLNGLSIHDIIVFNDVSGRIFLNVNFPGMSQGKLNGNAAVDIWSYKDAMLQSEQLEILKARRNSRSTPDFMAVLNVEDHQLIRLEYEGEYVGSALYNNKAMHYVLLFKGESGGRDEWNWNLKSRKTAYLVDLNTGQRRLIEGDLPGLNTWVLTYNEHYIVYYDPGVKGYYSYKISDGTRRNITLGVRGWWENEATADEPDGIYRPCGIAGLIKDQDAILVYDQRDLFRLDPSSPAPARNLTGTANPLHDRVFRLLNLTGVIDSNESILLRVLNKTNKESCITQISMGVKSSVPSLKFEPYRLDLRPWGEARDKPAYMVEKRSAEESPNLFFTNDFRKYTSITSIHPERAYNWMTSELVTWKTFDGGQSQGVLYKPENFDLKRKYPLLVFYYERLSDGIHDFLSPGISDGSLNIPYYVSHGYLVFEPDIHYKVGWPGGSAYNCVISGVEYLTKRAYVDAKRMGLQGHSFGGFETEYIITHTKMFAAAMSASGMSDFISAYGSVIGGGSSRQRQYELSRDRIGATLWSRPELYIENSPVLRADKITTPVLMMTNYADNDVPCQQGIEFFTALRRLGKKAWMLQYDGEEHQLFGKAAQEDLTQRMAQFFNYYLMGEPPPRWMTIGVPASLKGIDSGLETDSTGAKP